MQDLNLNSKSTKKSAKEEKIRNDKKICSIPSEDLMVEYDDSTDFGMSSVENNSTKNNVLFYW